MLKEFADSISDAQRDITKTLFLNFVDNIPRDSTILDVGKNDLHCYHDKDVADIIVRKNVKIKYLDQSYDTKMIEKKANELKTLSSNISISNKSFFIEKDEFDYIVFFHNMDQSGSFGMKWIIEKKEQNFKNLVIYQNFYQQENMWLVRFHPYLKYLCNEIFEKHIPRQVVERVLNFVPFQINLVHIVKFCEYDYLKSIPLVRNVSLEIFKTEVDLEEKFLNKN